MSDSASQAGAREIESRAETRVREWRVSKSNVAPLKEELMALICDKSFHSAKLMRLYAEVLLRNAELVEGCAAFDTYVSLQKLALIKLKTGARSLPDSVEEGTVSIFLLLLEVFEQQGDGSNARILQLEGQLDEILDQYPERHAAATEAKVAPIYARINVAKLLTTDNDEHYKQVIEITGQWFKAAGDHLDAETDYARAMYVALVDGPIPAFEIAKETFKRAPEHIRNALLTTQLLSGTNALQEALDFANIFLGRQPEARTIVDKIALLRLKKTQIALLEVLKGSEAALPELTQFVDFVGLLFSIDAPANGSNGSNGSNGTHTNINGAATRYTNGTNTNGSSSAAAAAQAANGASPKPNRRIFSFKRRSTSNSLVSAPATRSPEASARRQIGESDARIVAFSWFWISQQYGKVGLDNDAREALQEGQSYLPTDNELIAMAHVHALYGQLEQKTDSERALKHFLQALEIDPVNIAAAVGAALIVTDEKAEPVTQKNKIALFLVGVLNSICHRTPGRYVPEAWYLSGLLNEKLGTVGEAKKMYWKAMELEERRGVTSYVFSSDPSLS